MKPRTIVGSHPHRRTLPMGREAVERALRLCRRHPKARNAAEACIIARRCTNPQDWLSTGPIWLPHDVRYKARYILEGMLAEMPARDFETLEDLASDFLDACEAMLSEVGPP